MAKLPGGLSKKAKAAKRVPSRRELLALQPVRNPALEWEELGGRVILRITHPSGGSLKMRLMRLFVPLPKERKVELDAIGTDVWHMLDGSNTVGDIARALATKRKLEVREAELAVQRYFKLLVQRGYIGFNSAPGEVRAQQSSAERKG